MAAVFSVTGRILRVDPIQNIPTKTGKTFPKRIIVVETLEANPSIIPFELVGKIANEADDFVVKSIVKINFEISCREYNNNWYCSNKPVSIDRIGSQASDNKELLTDESTMSANEFFDTEGDLPF